MREQNFDLSQWLNSRPKLDLTYRFIFWFSLTTGLWLLVMQADENGGAYLKVGMQSGDSGYYWNIIMMCGLVLFSLTIWLKHIRLKLYDTDFNKWLVYPEALLTKLTTTIFESAFGLLSAFMATLLFAAITLRDIKIFELITFSFTLFLSLSVFLFAVGALLLILKRPWSDIVKVKLIHVPLPVVVISYPAIIWIICLFFWSY
ncbi:hypothetical protein [Alkalimonas amylolytica]|nr:hypothetical protein [Alkalimonas amylolytica]